MREKKFPKWDIHLLMEIEDGREMMGFEPNIYSITGWEIPKYIDEKYGDKKYT